MSPPAPPSRLGHGDAEQPELGGLPQLGEREAPVRVELLGDRGHDAFCEAPHRVAEEAMLVGEVEVHGPHDSRPD